jgi:hypothetical protein
MDQFTSVATARAEALQKRIEEQRDQASIRYVFAPLFDMIVQPLSTMISKGRITPISEQGQPVGEVYLMTLVRDGETLDPGAYKLKDGVGEVAINPAPIVDELLSQYGPQGAIQVKSLFNLAIDKFLDCDLNYFIFAEREYETAAEYLERFAFVRSAATLPSHVKQLADRVLSELEASVNVAFAWAKMKAEQSNQALKSGDIKKFSPFEAKLFKFSGVTPIDEAMNQVALNQAALASSLPDTITSLREAVVESKPDWKEIGASIAEGVKTGVKEAIAAVLPQAAQPAKEESPKPAAPKSGNKNS